jgi:hypothetical protein
LGSRIPRIAACLLTAGLVLPLTAHAQSSAVVDPETPAGKEYAIPLKKAREEAAGGEQRDSAGNRAGESGSAPLFGEGIEEPSNSPEASGGAGTPGDGGGGSGNGKKGSDGSGNGDSPVAGDSGSGRGSSMAIEAAATGGSDALVTAGIAGFVLAAGLGVGLGLRRLLRSE